MKTILKITSVLQIISGVLTILLAIFSFIGGGLIGAFGTEASSVSQAANTIITVVTLAFGLVLLFTGIFNLVCGIMGWKGAKGAVEKLKTALVLGWISLVLSAGSTIFNLATSTKAVNPVSALLGLALPILFVVSATCVKNEELNQ